MNMVKLIHRILYFLDRDSRTTLSKIAKRLRVSEQRVSYAVKSSINKKEIRNFSTVFDYTKFGFNAYLVLLKTNHKNKEELGSLLKDLKDVPEAVIVETMQGKFDIMVMFLYPNPSSFNKSLKKFISSHKALIRDNFISTVIVIHKFGRKYLNPWMKIGEDKVIGGDRLPIDLSDSEKKICNALVENSDASLKKLGKITGLTFKTLSFKMRKLRRGKIIRKFEPVLDCNKLGIVNKKIMLRYFDYDVRSENSITNLCNVHPNVVSIIKTFGKWDLIINFESLKEDNFDKFIDELREKYDNFIEDFEILEVRHKEKYNYLPSNCFEN